MSDYDWWRAALASPELIGTDLPIHDGSPQCGFFVIRSRKVWKDGVARVADPEPVAIWRDEEGDLVAVEGRGEWARHVAPDDVWTWCAANPISESLYRHLADGGDWPAEYLPKSFKATGEAA